MNLKALPFNYMSIAVLASSVTVGALAINYPTLNTESNLSFQIPSSAPVKHSLQSVTITGDNTGTAVIALNDFMLNVQFRFEAHNDDYGVAGHDFTAIEITNLDEIKVTADGVEFRDFTTQDDHSNINLLIATYIENNNLVEAV